MTVHVFKIEMYTTIKYLYFMKFHIGEIFLQVVGICCGHNPWLGLWYYKGKIPPTTLENPTIVSHDSTKK